MAAGPTSSSPCSAGTRVAEQRNALETLLCQIENVEDRRRVAGAAVRDVSWMRAELGIDSSES